MMADIKDFPFNSEGEHELKLGSSFNLAGKADSAFHTIRCEYAVFLIRRNFCPPRVLGFVIVKNYLIRFIDSVYPHNFYMGLSKILHL